MNTMMRWRWRYCEKQKVTKPPGGNLGAQSSNGVHNEKV